MNQHLENDFKMVSLTVKGFANEDKAKGAGDKMEEVGKLESI